MTISHLRNFILATALLSGTSAYAQSNVGIGTSSPNSTAILDITDLGKGLLIPRMSDVQRTGISSPAQGLMVYQTNTASASSPEGLYYYDSTLGWRFVNPSGIPDNLGNHLATQALNLNSNNITNTAAITGAGSNIGTTLGIGVRADGGLNIGQNTTNNNLLVGYQAGQGGATGGFNTSVGVLSGASNSSTYANNAFLGYKSGFLSNGSNNTYLGALAASAGTGAGANNVFVGTSSGANNAGGGNNLFAGAESGTVNTSGSRNTFLGYRSGKSNVAGADNTFVGYQSGNLNTGNQNVFIGDNAGANNAGSAGVQYIGFESGKVATATNNQFIGFQSGVNTTTGGTNMFSGFQSGFNNVSGTNNQFTGFKSGFNNNIGNGVGGSFNHFDGNQSGFANTTGSFNQFSGNQSGSSNTTGSNNLCIGHMAGNSTVTPTPGTATGVANTTGSFNTFIGWQAGPTTNNLSNAAAIGYLARVSQDNSLVLGAPAGSTFAVKVGIGVTNPAYPLEVAGDINAIGKVYANGLQLTSDRRFKQDIKTLPGTLAQVQRLRGVSYTFRQKEFAARNFPTGQQIGVIAQELEQVFPELVTTAADGYKAVNYAQLTPVLIEAIKELASQNTALRQQLTEQQGRDAGQTAEIRTMQKQLARLLGEESASASAK
jgi:hypothetical protein